MKKVMFALCFMFGGIVVVTAQDTQDTTSNQYRTETQSQYPQDDQAMQRQDNQAMQGQDQQDRERIQTTELPDEVKRTLEGQEYRGWLISGAFKAKAGQESSGMNGQDNTASPDNTNRQESANATGAEDEEIYIVELKNGAETKTVRFDQSGEQIEGMDDSQGTQNSQFSQDQETSPGNQSDQSSNRYNQSPESGQTDPSSTTDPAEGSQSEQSTETRTDQSTSPDQSTGTSDTETQSSQSTQTDQSSANEPE